MVTKNKYSKKVKFKKCENVQNAKMWKLSKHKIVKTVTTQNVETAQTKKNVKTQKCENGQKAKI